MQIRQAVIRCYVMRLVTDQGSNDRLIMVVALRELLSSQTTQTPALHLVSSPQAAALGVFTRVTAHEHQPHSPVHVRNTAS